MFSFRTYRSIARAFLTRRSPYYVQFYIIGKCNLKCRQCNIVETNSRVSELSLDQIRKVAKNLCDVGAGIVLLTGGEPFMRHDLPEIVQIFVSLGLNVRLQTAGSKYATEAKLKECYDAGARDINVSLDSLDLDTFDYINAVPGSARNAIETIETISKVFRSSSSVLSFGTVLSRFNYKEIPAILEFAKRIGWYVSLVPVHIAPQDLPRGFRSFDDQFCFDPILYPQLDECAEKILKMKKQGWPLFDSERYIRSAVSFLKGNGPSWRRGGVCDSPDLYFAIRPNGDFSTCCDYTLKVPPNVGDSRFPLLFNSGAIRQMKEVREIVDNCEGCHYGSYPEVSLSVNDPRVFLERSWMVLKSGRGRLRSATCQSGFLEELKRVCAEYPEVYPVTQWQDPRLSQLIATWADSEQRRKILEQDNEKRKAQNRVRGSGPEPVFPAGVKKVGDPK